MSGGPDGEMKAAITRDAIRDVTKTDIDAGLPSFSVFAGCLET